MFAVRLMCTCHGMCTRAIFNLVVPLAHKATAMRTTDTPRRRARPSGAVTHLSNRAGDVDSTNRRSTRLITPGSRISTTATRTTITRITTTESAPSADQNGVMRHAGISPVITFEQLVAAYFDCRRTKRNTASALAFEQNLERNLCSLFDELDSGRYQPGTSICFVVTHPKPREVWAADFRDRIVHHALYNQVGAAIEATFIAESCACIPGRGTLYAAQRLESKIRCITQNWSRPAFYLKCDLANFFVTIDKRVLEKQLTARIAAPWWRELALQILWHDPRANYTLRGQPETLSLVPPHKRLANQPAHLGLPIGNLSSQFYANIYLDALDQFAKHQVRARHYIRYVDDFVLLHESPHWLNAAKSQIESFLPQLGVTLNHRKTILQPVDRGVDFVGQVIKPWRRETRRRTVWAALQRAASVPREDLPATANSYFGLLGQSTSSHHDRARLANLVRSRGLSVNRQLRKV